MKEMVLMMSTHFVLPTRLNLMAVVVSTVCEQVQFVVEVDEFLS
jgi:hypothetical protein